MHRCTISHIDPDSPLRHAAHPGDRLVSINGNPITDVLDYKYYAYDPELAVRLRRPDGTEHTVHVSKPLGGELGLDFETYLMDNAHSCANHCVFCFIDQMPPGMRPTLYFKDDDARLSFLMGNYMTLTNLSEREVQRIIHLHISPINVSVHATDPELRSFLLGNPRAGKTLEIMRRFSDGGITMNCQIVCCPDLNDGAQLQRTMHDLAALYPKVHSVSIVPVGLTKFREGLYPLTPFTPEHAAETLDLVNAFGDECVKKFGARIFFCADELYLKAGRELPPEEFYEEFTQLENGVGMLRLQQTEFRSALSLSDPPDGVPFSMAAGVSAAPFLEKLLCTAQEKYATIKGHVYAIENDFFRPHHRAGPHRAAAREGSRRAAADLEQHGAPRRAGLSRRHYPRAGQCRARRAHLPRGRRRLRSLRRHVRHPAGGAPARPGQWQHRRRGILQIQSP